MKYDSEIGFALFMMAVIFGGGGIVWLYAYISNNYSKADLKQIFWDSTPMGWGWKQLFGEKKKAKQAPIPSFQSIPPPPARPTSFKVGNNFHAPTYNTSSLNVPPLNHIGKPLVIQNWDRLTGMTVMAYGRRWHVVQAFNTSNGYEFTLQTGGMTNSVTFSIYKDMYDSHRVSVYCGGRTEIMDVGVCKDPNRLLYEIAYTFNEKFR